VFLHFREIGSGPPMIILHGVFGSSDNWFSIGKSFAENWKVYLIDQRNHGQSFHSDEFNYPVMANDINLFIQNESVGRPVVIGHSMGGKVAMQLAVNQPNLIKSLVVVDIAPKKYPVHHKQLLDGLFSIDLKNVSSRQDLELHISRFENNSAVRQLLMKNVGRDQNNNFKWKLNLNSINNNLEKLSDALDYTNPYYAKTLFIMGENSDYINNEDEEMIRQAFPNAKISSIQDAGHWVQADQPEQFIKVVEDFLSDS